MQDEFMAYFSEVDWCLELSRLNPRNVVIEKILHRLRGLKNKLKIIALKEHLAREYVMEQRMLDARKVLEELVQLDSGSAMPLVVLATHYLNFEEDPDKALQTILLAEKAANETGHFRRHVQAEKARIALTLNDYELFAGTLGKITKILIDSDQRDVGTERDFFDRADKKKLDPTLVEVFEAYLKSAASPK